MEGKCFLLEDSFGSEEAPSIPRLSSIWYVERVKTQRKAEGSVPFINKTECMMIAQSMLLKFQAVNTEIVVKGPRKIIHLLPEKKGPADPELRQKEVE